MALISPHVPDAAVPTPKLPKRTLLVVAIHCGNESVTAPVAELATI